MQIQTVDFLGYFIEPSMNNSQNASPSLSNNMLVTSIQQPQNTIPVGHSLMTHALAPMKIQSSNAGYPLLQSLHLAGAPGGLSAVNVPVQMPGANSSINVHLTGPPNSVPLHLQGPPMSMPLVSNTTNVPVQLPAGTTINVPLQLPVSSANIQLAGSSLPLHLQNPTAVTSMHSPFIHLLQSPQHSSQNLQMSNTMDTITSNAQMKTSQQLQLIDNNVHMKLKNNNTSISSIQVPNNTMQIQMQNATSNSMQMQIPNSTNAQAVNIRNNSRSAIPQVVYIQTSSGLKPVTNAEMLSTATSSGNPPHIIVRRPVTNTPSIQILPSVTTKGNLTTKSTLSSKSSVLAPANSSQPIVIQKPKTSSNTVPVTIGSNPAGKQGITYVGTVKKASKLSENQSVLNANNKVTNLPSSNNQKVFLTPMNMPKIQNPPKYILPSMSSKGPIINLQIANGKIQNDLQGNITVMRDHGSLSDGVDIPPLQPLGKSLSNMSTNNKDPLAGNQPMGPNNENSFAISIPGSRVEPTGEQEYTLSIPETTASMNDDLYTVSIADDDDLSNITEKSFTLTVPEKGKSLLSRSNHNHIDRTEFCNISIPAPAILRRSNSENIDKKPFYVNAKRRISLCNDFKEQTKLKKNESQKLNNQLAHKFQLSEIPNKQVEQQVPSLFCDEKLDKDLEYKFTSNKSICENIKHCTQQSKNHIANYDENDEKINDKPIDIVSLTEVESAKGIDLFKHIKDAEQEIDPLGLIWNKGIAILPGSYLQFKTNEFGLIDVMQDYDPDSNLIFNPSIKYNTPLKQRLGREKKPTSPEDLYCCDGCGCHGMAAEFVTPNFCSHTCQNDYKKVCLKKREVELADLKKRRKKNKRILTKSKPKLKIEYEEQNENTQSIQDRDDISDPPSIIVNNLIEDVNPKYPWICNKTGFSWTKYLEYQNAEPAPLIFFNDSLQYGKNDFQEGMKLEAIDPVHPGIFAVVTVSEVLGYRLRLHFDGYHENYDFWVNADSKDIFYLTWCDKMNRILQAPQGFSQGSFSPSQYISETKSVAAPHHLFVHSDTTVDFPNGFQIGMKLEAEDRKNSLLCVATVADILDNRILVHFDSWDDIYDYWAEPSSPYIHPVGWAEENRLSLTPPNFYKDPEKFTWEKYLLETEATAAPARAFKPRLPKGFRVGMKLEVVDKRAPFLIRVATISAVKSHQILISFDGWPDELSFWMDDDSPDIHSVGWCLKTGHPLEPPLTSEELLVAGACGTVGCRGLGSVLGGGQKAHRTAAACPYRRANLPTQPDRLAKELPPAETSIPRSKEPKKLGAALRGRPRKYFSVSSNSEPQKERTPAPRGRPRKHKPLEMNRPTEQASDDDSNSSTGDVGQCKRSRQEVVEQSVLGVGVTVRQSRYPPPSWSLFCPDVSTILRGLPSLDADPRNWSQSNVQEFVKRAVQCKSAAGALGRHRVAGDSLLMLSQEEMVDVLHMRLGPTIKLYSTIVQLRKSLVS